MGTEDKGKRNRTLDCVRALCVFGVILFHYFARWVPPRADVDLYHYDRAFSQLLEVGSVGVQVFFILSGFFISQTLLRSHDAADFLYRRCVRILPAFFIACTIVFAAMNLVGPPRLESGLYDYAMSLLLMPGTVPAKWVDGAYWTLAVEVKFYSFTAIAFLMLRQRFYLGLLTLAVIGNLAWLVSPWLGREIFIAPNICYFLIGVGLAKINDESRLRSYACLIAGTVFFLPHAKALGLNEAIAAVVATLALATLIIRDVRWNSKILAHLGVISYEIYLVHQNLGVTLIGWLKTSLHLNDFIAAGIAIAMACLVAEAVHAMQKPISRYVRSIYLRSRPSLAAA